MKKTIIMLVMGLVTLQAQAQNLDMNQLYPMDIVMKYRKEIQLEEKKVDKIKTLYNEQMAEFNSLKWDLDAEISQLNKMLLPSKIDPAASKKQLDQVLAIEKELKKIKMGLLIAIKNELSEDQQNKLQELRTPEDMRSQDLITSINENPRVVVRVEGKEDKVQPIYYVKKDDKLEETPSVAHLDPNDIESLEVLKGEKAVDRFGDKAKNGVVIITLK